MDKKRLYYGTDENQFADLRIPNGAGPHPVIVIIHGGFWYARYGLDLMDAMAEDLTARGYATWNLEYRRVGQSGGGFPGTLQDVSRAVDYLRDISDTYLLDLTQVVAVGHSAGGHLALWVGGRHRLTQASSLRTNADSFLPLKGVVSLAGVSDLKRMYEVRQENSPVVNFLGGTPTEFPERYQESSPLELLPLGISQVLIHGTEDVNVPIEISRNYYQAAKSLRDQIELIELPGIEHFKVIDPKSEIWRLISDAIDELIVNHK